ncbi:ubiquitin carboxyl-terminal hydrolase 17-like protein D [Oryzias latipes]|uniref:Ubiquitin carboxyl-terminal hydrolase n=1 Tax=Oryzias latipes TaxID=8090 RepID=A0A3B3HHV4_ORYLA|nr:ubiquitin carboxyl-terminal hydrolase 17-like protein D [Oryzias latipes]
MGRRKNKKRQIIDQPDSIDNRYHGLRNQGATCYLNSVLQVLFMTKDFRKAVISSSEPDMIDHHLTSLFENLQNNSANTYAITKQLGITRVHEQQDAAECLEKILHCTSFKASQIFKGELTHRSTCSKCRRVSEDSSLFWSLPLTLMDPEKHDYSVTEGIKSFLGESSISGDDLIYCEQCNAKTDSTSKCELKRHPQVLTLLLKRFKFDCSTMQYVKLKRRVQIPLILQVPRHGDQSQGYELYALVEHSGELRHGHYTATIRAQDDNRWYHFNDISVTAALQQKNIQDDINSQTAYLLFYRKTEDTTTVDTSEMSKPEAEDKPCRDQDVKSSNNQETTMRRTTDNRNAPDNDRTKSPKKSKRGKRSGAKDNDLEPASPKVIKIEKAQTGSNFDHKQIVFDKKDEKEKPDQGLECNNCELSSSPAEQMEENRKRGEEQKITKRESAGLHSEGEGDTAEKNPNTGENLQPKEAQVPIENEVKEKEKSKEDERDHLFLERSDMSTFKDSTPTHSSDVKASVPKDNEEASPEEQCGADPQKMDEKSEEELRLDEKMTERSKGPYEGSDRTIGSDQISKIEDPGKATLNDLSSDRAEERTEQEKDAFKTEDEASASIQVTPDVDVLAANLTKLSLESPEPPGQSANDLRGKLQSSTETQSFDEKNDGALKKSEALNSGKRKGSMKKDKKGKYKQKHVIFQRGLVTTR